MFDCVYPTRTARFGVALVPGLAPGTLRLKSNECFDASAPLTATTTEISPSAMSSSTETTQGMEQITSEASSSNNFASQVLQDDCLCQACRSGISKHRLHTLFKAGNTVAVELLTQHNVAYMMALVRKMRQAILDDCFPDFCTTFVREQYPGPENGGEDVPKWVVDALEASGIRI